MLNKAFKGLYGYAKDAVQRSSGMEAALSSLVLMI